MMAMLDVDPLAEELGERFTTAGFELYLVGGVVRDAMLGRTSPDMDLATSAKPHETTRMLQGWADHRYQAGVRFGTIGARKDGRLFEITTFREEIYEEEHRRPAVTFAKDIETDLSRRDFTINAMAVRLPDGEFLDPFGGVKHLAAKTLDTPLEPEVAFSDDPLRMLRAARFVSQLEVEPSERVVRAIGEMRERLAIVSGERIRAELDKLLVGARPSAGLALIVDTGLSDEFLPELSALQLEQDPVHQHKDVLHHTYAVVENCEPDLVLRLAGLLHDIGKPKTREITPDGVQFHHHEVVGARMAEARLKELHYPNAIVDDIRRLVELHLRFHGYGDGWTDSAVRRYVRDAGPLLDRLNQLTRADCTTRNVARARKLEQLQDELEERIARLAEEENLNALRPPIDGAQVMKHLGIPPGPLVGEALAHLFELRMERGPIPEDEALELLDAWAAGRDLGI
ncbi:MAG: CCA tRNA nucleotidyltransferase [Actinomycetota bacterium]